MKYDEYLKASADEVVENLRDIIKQNLDKKKDELVVQDLEGNKTIFITKDEYTKLEQEYERMKEVNDVLNNNPVYDRIRAQIEKGLAKYGEPVNPDNYSISGWINHMSDELVDGLTYNNMLKNKIDTVIKTLEVAKNNDDIILVHEHIKYALQIIKDGKE